MTPQLSKMTFRVKTEVTEMTAWVKKTLLNITVYSVIHDFSEFIRCLTLRFVDLHNRLLPSFGGSEVPTILPL